MSPYAIIRPAMGSPQTRVRRGCPPHIPAHWGCHRTLQHSGRRQDGPRRDRSAQTPEPRTMMSFGFTARRSSQPKPHFSITPGRKFSMTTSAPFHQPLEDVPSLRPPKVAGDRFLVSADDFPPERYAIVNRRHFAHGVPRAWHLELDDFGAEFGEKCRRPRGPRSCGPARGLPPLPLDIGRPGWVAVGMACKGLRGYGSPSVLTIKGGGKRENVASGEHHWGKLAYDTCSPH